MSSKPLAHLPSVTGHGKRGYAEGDCGSALNACEKNPLPLETSSRKLPANIETPPLYKKCAQTVYKFRFSPFWQPEYTRESCGLGLTEKKASANIDFKYLDCEPIAMFFGVSCITKIDNVEIIQPSDQSCFQKMIARFLHTSSR